MNLRYIYITLGFISIGLGIIGVFVPILPTTPFLLLALWFFSRSSARWRDWLLSNKLCGEYLNNYQSGSGIPLRTKAYIITLLWSTIITSALYSTDQIWLKALLFIIATCTTIHICKIKTKK